MAARADALPESSESKAILSFSECAAEKFSPMMVLHNSLLDYSGRP
ncbi:hypothetical protein LC609_36055 [Nostoc sp. XA013]|nr:hypothetical protein [Nostoc desertorum CM1-VF14]MCC5655081.1 hypothetical protein [Nostoc sp. XA013]